MMGLTRDELRGPPKCDIGFATQLGQGWGDLLFRSFGKHPEPRRAAFERPPLAPLADAIAKILRCRDENYDVRWLSFMLVFPAGFPIEASLCAEMMASRVERTRNAAAIGLMGGSAEAARPFRAEFAQALEKETGLHARKCLAMALRFVDGERRASFP